MNLSSTHANILIITIETKYARSRHSISNYLKEILDRTHATVQFLEDIPLLGKSQVD
jgi:hypothetical protein